MLKFLGDVVFGAIFVLGAVTVLIVTPAVIDLECESTDTGISCSTSKEN